MQKLGAWQRRVMLRAHQTQRPFNPLESLTGKADLWSDRYRKSLASMVRAGLLVEVPGGYILAQGVKHG